MKDKMKDPQYVQSMRQDLIRSVFQGIKHDSTFHFSANDGKDCIVQTCDNLIDTQVNVVVPGPKKPTSK